MLLFQYKADPVAGNEFVSNLTALKNYTLRVDIIDDKGNNSWAEWAGFAVGSLDTNYTLSVGAYNTSGTAGWLYVYCRFVLFHILLLVHTDLVTFGRPHVGYSSRPAYLY